MSISAGMRLGGKYELIRQLGEGGMGVVWLAKHTDLGTEVAVKVLRASVLGDKEAVTRFDREARAAASLKGPHITRILDVGRHEDGSPFMVMEYLDGCDLGAEIASQGALPIAQAVHYVMQACEGMQEAHARGVVHRDLKPENLFLVQSSGRREVKILDFGISKFHVDGDLRVTQTQTSFGTPLYMSPEQVRSTKNVDHRTDIWSLGVILYEALTGEPPFMGETPTAVAVAVTVDTYPPLLTKRPEAPPELEEVIARALAKDPAKRYQTADELADALDPFCDVAPSAVPSRRISSGQHVAVTNTMRVSSVDVPARGSSKRGSSLLIVGLAAGMGLAVVAALMVLRTHKPTEVGPASSLPANTVAAASAPTGAVAPRAPDIQPVNAPPSSSSAIGDAAPPEKTASPPDKSASPPDKSSPKDTSKHPALPKTAEPVESPPPEKSAKPAKPVDRNPQFL